LLTTIRDRYDTLVSIKGRTIIDDYKEIGISKFLAYYKYNASQILYGLHKNELDIFINDEVIIVEGEKSVQQLYSIGVKNVVSISKKKISARQEKMLLELQVKIVIALDKDVSYEEVIQEAEKFNGFAKVEVIWDWDDLLNDNDSPSDHGSFVWACLYESRVTIDEFKRRTIEEFRANGLVG
jgi:DNA primase